MAIPLVGEEAFTRTIDAGRMMTLDEATSPWVILPDITAPKVKPNRFGHQAPTTLA